MASFALVSTAVFLRDTEGVPIVALDIAGESGASCSDARVHQWVDTHLLVPRCVHTFDAFACVGAGPEKDFPASIHKEAYAFAQSHFMYKTVHASEAYGPQSEFQAITALDAGEVHVNACAGAFPLGGVTHVTTLVEDSC